MGAIVKIKSMTIGTISTVIEVITSILTALENWGDAYRNWKISRKTKKKYTEADEALKDRDVKKINDILQR